MRSISLCTVCCTRVWPRETGARNVRKSELTSYFNYISTAKPERVLNPEGQIRSYGSRMFEYTPDDISSRLSSLDEEAIDYMKGISTFYCSEVYHEDNLAKIAIRFGKITDIKIEERDVIFIFDTYADFGIVSFENEEDICSTFGVERFQLHRTHWAVRQGYWFDIIEKINKNIINIDGAKSTEPPRGNIESNISIPPIDKKEIGFADSVYSFLEQLDNIEIDDESQLFFRGHSNRSYELTLSIMRKNQIGNYIFLHTEDVIYKELLIAHYDEFQSDNCTFDKLVRMQHFGLPTRLLDLTSNPLFALYFSAANEGEDEGEVVVFSIKSRSINYFDSDKVSIIANLSQIPWIDKNAINPDLENENFNKTDAIQSLYSYVRSEKLHFNSSISPADVSSVVFVKAKQTNARIRSQSGAFLIFGHEAKLPEDGFDYMKIYRIVIKNKSDILKQLNRININNKTAYPGIEKTAEHIKSLYKS
jgi:hypothetical protein